MLNLDKVEAIVAAEKYCHLDKGHETDTKVQGNFFSTSLEKGSLKLDNRKSVTGDVEVYLTIVKLMLANSAKPRNSFTVI